MTTYFSLVSQTLDDPECVTLRMLARWNVALDVRFAESASHPFFRVVSLGDDHFSRGHVFGEDFPTLREALAYALWCVITPPLDPVDVIEDDTPF